MERINKVKIDLRGDFMNTTIRIGSFVPKNNIFLAPMAGVTDMPFRYLCSRMGAGLTYTEMVSSKGMYYNDKKPSF